MIIRKSTCLAAWASILSAFACNVQARDMGKDDPADVPTFENIDMNADGFITTSEARKRDLWVANNFRIIDSNRDSRISKEEFDQVVG